MAEADVLKFIAVLQRAPPFTSSDYAAAIGTFLLNKVNLTDLADLVGKRDVNKDALFLEIEKNHPEFRQHAEKLGAATLSWAVATLQPKDEYGFSESANKDKATVLANESLANLVPYLIETHIDNELNKAAIGQLHILATLEDYKQTFFKVLQSNAVQQTVAEAATSFNPSNYRANLLFVYEYFRLGKTPFIHGFVPGADDDRPFSDVVKFWLEQTTAPSENTSFADVFNKILEAQTGTPAPTAVVSDWGKFSRDLAQILLPVDIVYLPDMKMDSGLPIIAEKVLAAVAPELVKNDAVKQQLLMSIPHDTMSFAHAIWSDWATVMETIRGACQKSIATELVTPKLRRLSGDNPGFTHLYDVKDHSYGDALANAQIRCKVIDVWNKERNDIVPAEDDWDNRHWNITQKGLKPRWWMEQLGRSSKSSCFLPGTTVITSVGEMPIEDVTESVRVLTRAESDEWGITSDERVAIPNDGGRVIVCGINDEPAFFTANHPFIDKFGLARAIDPEGAQAENPWLEVGTLRVGHVLLRTTDGKAYEEIVVRKITFAEVDCTHVHGLHLREGLRSYHANGYLVRLNYPEITIKSIADALRKLPQVDQLRVLKQLHEIEPLLARFGQGTVMQMLRNELGRSDGELASMKHKQPSGPSPPGLYFQSRSFSLVSDDKRAGDGTEYRLPEVDCYDGQLWLNGVPCERFRMTKRGLLWSRQLNESLWEHAVCSFGSDEHLITGDGLIFLESDPNPAKPSQSGIHFQAQSTSLRDHENRLVQPELDMGDVAASAAEEVFEEGGPSEHEEADGKVEGDANFGDDVASENDGSAQDELTTGLSAFKQIIADPQPFIDRQKVVDEIDGPTPISSAGAITDAVERYNITCDADAITDGPSGRPPVLVFTVEKIRKGTSNGVTTFDFTIPALDLLTQKLNQTLPNDVKAASFYQTFVTLNEQNEMIVEIEIKAPERLALAADDNVSSAGYGETAKSYKDLKFTNHGLTELMLPFAFQKIVFTTNTLQGLIAGQMIEFDPESVGDTGRWYMLRGTRIDLPKQPVSPVLAQPITTPASGGSTVGQPARFLPSHPSTRSVQDLMTGFRVDTTALKQDTQALLYRTMLYHMHDGDRTGILNISEKPKVSDGATFAPDALPSALAEDLELNLREWIKNSYASAWIAQNIACMSDEQKKVFNLTFDSALQRKLNYFWNGSGKRCLSKSKEYNEVNARIAIIAFRLRYPRILTYLDDKVPITKESESAKLQGMTGGKKWAHLLFEALLQEDQVAQIARESTIAEFTKLNKLEMYCTMLNALWRDDAKLHTLPLQLSDAVRASLMKQQLFKHRSIGDPKQLEDGVRDYLLSFFELVLDEAKAIAAGIDLTFRKSMIASMKSFCKWNDDYAKRTARQNAESMLAQSSAIIKSAANYATGSTESPQTFRSGLKGIARMFQGIRRAINGVKGDYSGQGSPPAIEAQPITGALCFGLGLVMTFMYVKTSWDSWGMWISGDERLTALDKTRLVASALQAIGGLVFTSYKALQIAKGWDPKNIKKVGEMSHAVADGLEMTVITKSMHMHPDAVLESTDLTARVRRNAVVSKEMAVGTQKSRNVADALLPDAQKPVPWRQRVTNLKDSAKSKVKGWGKAIKAKCQFNMTETLIRGFAAGLSLVMLVLACITAGQLWAEQSPVEKFLAVLNLLVQFANLILEVAAIFCAVPMWIGLAVMLVGLGLTLLINWIVGEPKPPTPPVVSWWQANGPSNKSGLFSRMPDEPSARHTYQINTTKLTPGNDTTLVITCKPRDNLVDDGFKRLTSINCRFTASVGETSSLFDEKKQKMKDETDQTQDPQPGSCTVVLPASLQATRKTATGTDKRAFVAGMTSIATSTKVKTFDLGIDVDADDLPAEQALPSISLSASEEIVFKLRGVIALPAAKDEKDKTDYSKSIPPWRKYELRIVESYADDNDEPQGVLESVIALEKLETTT